VSDPLLLLMFQAIFYMMISDVAPTIHIIVFD
jgi:hypothetical protein